MRYARIETSKGPAFINVDHISLITTSGGDTTIFMNDGNVRLTVSGPSLEELLERLSATREL